jgi:hypothetical protein
MDDGRAGSAGAVVSAARLRASAGAVRVGPPRPAETGPEPKVQVFHEDDVVRMIQVVCTCGERIRIRCDYT